MDTAAIPSPLADLHRHLDGSLRRDTLLELADQCGVRVPEQLAFRPGMGLDEALARFAVTLSVLQNPDAVRRVAAEICQDASREGVDTLEIRFAPQLHRAAPAAEIVDAALDGVGGRAGIILCGLYGEAPTVLLELVELARSRPGVVGIDLAGGPASGHAFAMRDYALAFAAARGLGLGRTVHAGEGRPPAEIRVAIETLFATRIGHGTTLLEDGAVLDLVVERGITVEACITSNWHTGAIADPEAHPLPRWLAAGVRVCVCTDNTLLSEVDAPSEYARAARLPGMSADAISRLADLGRSGAFARR